MTGVARAVFRALHEGKWLSIEYRNGFDKVTRFWAGIRGLNAKNRSLIVDGLHLHNYTVKEHTLYLDRIQWAEVVEGSFCPRNEALLRDMDNDPRRYDALFGSTANLRVLDYLAACSKLDNTPYRADYQLIERLDESRLQNGVYQLDDGQFRQIVERFQQRTTRKRRPGEPLRLVSLGLNLLSIPAKDGLYVLAYRALYLDVKNRTLRAAEEVTLCREFLLDARQNVTAVQSIRQFLDADDLVLLDDFEKNQERIKDLITAKNPTLGGVDDMPYFVGIGRDCITDLNQQYSGILDLYENDEAPVPLRAFFGELTSRPRRRPAVPLALLDDHVNLDQLLAMNNAATKSSRLSSSTCSLSMRSNAAPNSRRRRRGIYMLTNSSSSASALPEASSRCNSSMRKTCFLPGLRRNRCPLFSRSSFRRAFSSASSAAYRIASRSSSGGADGCFGLRLSICPPHYSLYRRLMFAQ